MKKPEANNPETNIVSLFRSLKKYTLIRIAIIILLSLGISISAVLYHIHSVNSANKRETAQSQNNVTPATTPDVAAPAPITASSIVTLLNQQRTAKNLPALKWITQLDTAAVARANYMVSNNTTSATVGDPGGDITDTNYSYRNASWNDTWNDSTTQDVVNDLTTGANSNFGYTTSYSDIGVGVVTDTISGNPTQLIFVYLANQATAPAYVAPPLTYMPPPAALLGPPCSYPETGFYPNCSCPPADTGIPPDCIAPCPIGDTGIAPDCIAPYYSY